MTFNFAVQKSPAFGSYGEFSVGTGASQIRAQYLLTKIKPGQQGLWENQLASQMAPWREIFRIEELSFDELIQRDLDDSRVAHDLIPYLLGTTGQHARFFPPVLAVLVPKKEGGSGIAPRYPEPSIGQDVISFGDLFDFEKAKIDGKASPLGAIRYNPQRSAIVIVDGQHRAMAILALHRQINKSWGSDPFAPYYSHIQVDPEMVAHMELPVCIIFFPDLHEGKTEFKESGINLITVCREIFIAVNRQAKQVSKSRELLLDDEDFAAFMMRRTLTRFKDRDGAEAGAARIYTFAFGDSEADSGGQAMMGQLQFCSAVALHKMHAATGFALPAAFNLSKTADVTSGINVRNPIRPAEILTGSGLALQSLTRRSAKNHKPAEVTFIADKIGELTDCVMLPLFDGLRPYVAHNQAMRELLEALSDPAVVADPVQAKCRSLIFDGTGNRHVFDDHVERLNESAKELRDQGKPIPAHISAQQSYCDAVSHALLAREEAVKIQRAFLLFNIDEASFRNREEKSKVEADLKEMRARAKGIFDAVSTQAFQIGYLMAVLSHVEILLPSNATYDDRLSLTKFVSNLYLAGLNRFFSVSTTKHRTLSGYAIEPRAKAFEAGEPGFRGLLAAGNVRELNEKQWEFFRYMILEVVHSRLASGILLELLDKPENAAHAALFRDKLPFVAAEIEVLRTRYFEAAVRTAQGTPEFKREIDLIEMEARTQGKTDDAIKLLVDAAVSRKRAATIETCKAHLVASLGRMDSKTRIAKRFAAPGSASSPSSTSESESEVDSSPPKEANLEVAVATDNLQHDAKE